MPGIMSFLFHVIDERIYLEMYVLKICKALPKTTSCEITHCDAKTFGFLSELWPRRKTEAPFISLKFQVGRTQLKQTRKGRKKNPESCMP